MLKKMLVGLMLGGSLMLGTVGAAVAQPVISVGFQGNTPLGYVNAVVSNGYGGYGYGYSAPVCAPVYSAPVYTAPVYPTYYAPTYVHPDHPFYGHDRWERAGHFDRRDHR